MEESVPNKAALPQQQSPGSAANLDSFFKRLGQGQSSRLWAGPGRSGAVPGVLRTRLHPKRNEAGDESSYDASINRTVASAGGGRVPTGRAGVGSVNTSNLHSEDARRPDGGEGNGASAGKSLHARPHPYSVLSSWSRSYIAVVAPLAHHLAFSEINSGRRTASKRQ